MLFNSIEFLIFLPIVVILYYAIPFRFRWVLLLGASYYFYAVWKFEYILLIVASTLVDYVIGLQLGQSRGRWQRRILLACSLLFNLGLLFTFKYFLLFDQTAQIVANELGLSRSSRDLGLLLPVGISFYTFQTLAYTISLYRGTIQPERHLGRFALYVAFFPQLVAGPIELAQNLLPQFYEEHRPQYDRIVDGLLLIVWGLFKKVVIADRLALYVDQAFARPDDYYGLAVIVAMYFFAFQIYCDFSGYSDIAIGSAKLMGFQLCDNFRQPYFASSVVEFWQRWHISLSTWFRDYLYVPLGGNRVGRWYWYRNIWLVFLVSGLWHGAAWHFAIWGALHGTYYLVFIGTSELRARVVTFFWLSRHPMLLKGWQIFITFHFITFAWLFFRTDIPKALLMLQNIVRPSGTTTSLFNAITWPELMLALGLIVLLLLVDWIQEREPLHQFLRTKPSVVRWSVYAMLVLAIMNLGVLTDVPFIYFQF